MKIAAGDELEALVTLARRTAQHVGVLFREHCESGIDVEFKGPGDPVTRADREANELICDALATRFSDAAIVAEESVPEDPSELEQLVKQPRVFYVDPVDGTAEFVGKRPDYCVMIGLAEMGRAVAGVIALPESGVVIAGRVGGRAFAEERDGSRRLLAVPSCRDFAAARMLVSRSHRPRLIEPLRKRLGIGTVVPCGSVGVKVAQLVLENADLYVHAGRGMKRWDSCAPEAILAAAGGRLTDLDGLAIDYASSDLPLRRGLVATNGILHPGVLSAVVWAEREAEKEN
jgi:3'(2'), 5'-bisphosphate nucleotidase